jgi:DNA-binding GntR family transcriptional regulator
VAQKERLHELLEATTAAVSHEEWDAANAAFHEYQVDLAGNELLSRFYRELSVNLMMQVIRGGRLEVSDVLATEHRAIVEALEAGDAEAAERAIRAHIATGRRIALDAIAAAGGVL